MNVDRRAFLNACSAAGIVSPLLPGILWTLAVQAQEASSKREVKLEKITPLMIDRAAEMAGVGPFNDAQKKMMLDGLRDQRDAYAKIRAMKMANSVAPAFVFRPEVASEPLPRANANGPLWGLDGSPGHIDFYFPPVAGPEPLTRAQLEPLAFGSIRELAELIRMRKVTALALTQMYIERLKRYDAKLHFVITLTEERALAQAKKVDEEIAAGKYRGPLHGMPWGAKDLLAVKGYPTTWGAGGIEKQAFDEDATVVKRLDEAGAVLVAKLSLGALAMGDKWFGGRTRNPWKPELGSSGSSAGSAAAVAAGCVGFAIGSETLGSISSPSTRCGCSGLRPSFGMVPRTGAMALSWTMDKLGPICRSVEDCALVLEAIAGPDGKDAAAARVMFGANAAGDWKKLRIGYLKSEFDEPALKLADPTPEETAEEKQKRESANTTARDEHARRLYDRRYEQAALEKLRAMGVNLIPVELPKMPWEAMAPLLTAEAAAAFDDLTITGRDALLTEQGVEDWPNVFRTARYYPAVEYIQANRARMVGIEQMRELFEKVDVIVTPSTDLQLIATNLSGNPAVIVPNGLRGADAPAPPAVDDGDHDDIGGPGTPVSLTFLGGLYQDAKVAAFARAYQEATGFHKSHPQLG
jgi:Asp-tRNA(Asn)/Glu-tRNA(Gln) amidotransferase A subunit family amidase